MSFSNADTGNKPADPYKAKNLDEPPLKEKIDGLVNFVATSKFGMLTTRSGSSGLLASRCMAVAGQENGGIDLIFHTNTESGKTDDLDSDPNVNIAFLNGSGEWASISGHATVVTDREAVRAHYSPSLKAWLGDLGDGTHDGGPEDPRIGVIRVKARTATYAIAVGTVMGRGAEIIKGAVTGQAPKVSKLRELNEEDLDEWRRLNTK
jgi:general stress protein 26